MSTRTLTKERRQFTRAAWPAAVGINLLQPSGVGPIDRVNVSEGGLCLRLPAMLEVRSLVRLQLTPGNSLAGRSRRMECTGRVAWVTQRLDLRDMPPYLFDIGIEFVNLPKSVRRWLLQQEGRPAGTGRRPGVAQDARLTPVVARGRWFTPRIASDGARQARWHLIITVDETPCFSRRYPTEREALAAWERFRRGQCRGSRTPKP